MVDPPSTRHSVPQTVATPPGLSVFHLLPSLVCRHGKLVAAGAEQRAELTAS